VEHRCGPRRAVQISVRVSTRAGLVGRATLCQVSASGAYMLCNLPLAEYSTVTIQLEGWKAPALRKRVSLDAQIVRRTEAGFAVEWVDFAPEAICELNRPVSTASAGTEQEASIGSTAHLR
jgi:hypothetical protein